MTDGGGHASDLAVAAFDEFEFDPAVGDVLAKADGRIARGDDRLGIEERDSAWPGAGSGSCRTSAPTSRPTIRSVVFGI
jgi:hypothetical protein